MTSIAQLRALITYIINDLPTSAKIYAIDAPTADIITGERSTVLRNVSVSGDVSTLVVGQSVAIIWVTQPGSTGLVPLILANNTSNAEDFQSSINAEPDEVTITDADGVLSIKYGGVNQGHLDYSPSLVGHTHNEFLPGWEITEDGELYANGMYISPEGQIGIGVAPDIIKLDSTDDKFRLWAGAIDPEEANFVVDKYGNTYIKDYLESTHLDLELMKLQFQFIDWAQFAIFDALSDEVKRYDPEPATYPARILHGKLDNGDDDTASREFGFSSKVYNDITTVITGVSESAGTDYLQDNDAEWVDDQWRDNFQLIDDVNTVFTITGGTDVRVTVVAGGGGSGNWLNGYFPLDYFQDIGTYPYFLDFTVTGGAGPVVGDYNIRSVVPGFVLAFCSFTDSTNGGTGYTKLEVSFNGGSNWQILLDTFNSVNKLGSMIAIDTSGRDYQLKITIKNDGSGDGAIVHNLLICTDPSVYLT